MRNRRNEIGLESNFERESGLKQTVNQRIDSSEGVKVKPLLVIDAINAEVPNLPKWDITHAGCFIIEARETPCDLSQIRAPFPALIVGMALAPLAHSLSLDHPCSPFFEKIGRP